MDEIRGLVFLSRMDYVYNRRTSLIPRLIRQRLIQAQTIITEQVSAVKQHPLILKALDCLRPCSLTFPAQEIFKQTGKDFASTILDRYFFNYMELKSPCHFLVQFQKLYPRLWGFESDHSPPGNYQCIHISFAYEKNIHQSYHWFIEGFFRKVREITGGQKRSLFPIPAIQQDERYSVIFNSLEIENERI